MKEITRIHLASTPYNIEIEARKVLQKYLADIEKSLQADADTMKEIEARIVELLLEQGINGEKVITTYDVETVKGQLGEPGEFVDESDVQPPQAQGGKRLMRDTEGGLLGGVLSGIAAYYDVNVMWLRLAAIILGLVSFGTAFIVYVILWIIMPATKTVADRLQLKGERVTLESIKLHAGSAMDFNEKTKPLVRFLRALLGIGWAGLACLALIILLSSFMIFGVNNDSAHNIFNEWNTSSWWLLGGFGLMVLCGILAVVFCTIAAYASFSWKMNKRIATTLIGVAIAGIVLLSAAIGTGLYARYDYDRQVAANTHTKTIDVNEKLAGITTLDINSENVTVDYKVTKDTPHAEMTYTSKTAQSAPKVELHRSGETLNVKAVDSHDTCSDAPLWCRGSRITIYGPAVATIAVQNESSVSYAADSQPRLNLKTGTNAQFNLNEGIVTTLEAVAGRGTRISADGAAVADANITASDDTDFSFGSLNTLGLNVPNSCSTSGETHVYASHINVLKQDGKTVDQTAFASVKCLDMTIGDAGLSETE